MEVFGLVTNFSSSDIALALIAFLFAPSNAQIDCREEFFRVSRTGDSCVNFFVCMIGQRVDFFCDATLIFDEQRVICRPGDHVTCEFQIINIPEGSCDNHFYEIFPHPDPFQCEAFFVCMNNNMVQFRCAPDHIFSQTTRSCVPGNQINCRERGTPGQPQAPTPYENVMRSTRVINE